MEGHWGAPDLLAPPADPDVLTTVVVVLVCAATAAVLILPRVRRSRPWRATVTPLASIVGSGFLVVTPLLVAAFGPWAVLAMAGILPGLLALGAIASQFSAAVADTIGSGGLLHEIGGRRLPKRVAYTVIAAASLALIWSRNVFEVIAFASRAFALAYALYCVMAAVRAATRRRPSPQPQRAVGFAALALAMLAVAVAGIPAEAA